MFSLVELRIQCLGAGGPRARCWMVTGRIWGTAHLAKGALVRDLQHGGHAGVEWSFCCSGLYGVESRVTGY